MKLDHIRHKRKAAHTSTKAQPEKGMYLCAAR